MQSLPLPVQSTLFNVMSKAGIPAEVRLSALSARAPAVHSTLTYVSDQQATADVIIGPQSVL